MSQSLLPLKPKQHPVTSIPKFTTEFPFFYLTKRKDLLTQAIDFQGIDPEQRPIRWKVTPNPTIGAPGIEAHEVWVRLIKPALDAERERMLGKLPNLVPLGSVRECIRTLGWSIGGWESRRLMKCIRQIGSAWCEADFWMPTAEKDEEGRALYRHIKGEFSRISIYAIGSKHVTEEELQDGKLSFDFDLEDTVYLLLHPHEVEMQRNQNQRPIDNEYLFSVSPASRRWYELLAPKIFGVVENRKGQQEGGYCEILYSWYIKRHHTLKRHKDRYRVVEQMNDLIKDHRIFGYVEKVEYRAIKEPGQLVDYIIRYYPGEGAKRSINRIRSYRPRKKRSAQLSLPLPKEAAPSTPPSAGIAHETDQRIDPLIARLTSQPPDGFGVSETKARDLVRANRKAVEEQIAAFPYRDVGKAKKNVSGWLIAAIEGNYALPEAYLEEQEKKRVAAKSASAKAATKDCQFCDLNGWRRVRTPEHPNGAMKRCSHDPKVEAKYSTA
jgi:hypothetical protein